MSDFIALAIVALGLLGMVLSFLVVWRYWRARIVPVGVLSFLALGISAGTISAFYTFVYLSPVPMYDITVPISRGLWAFILVSTILMDLGVLVGIGYYLIDDDEEE